MALDGNSRRRLASHIRRVVDSASADQGIECGGERRVVLVCFRVHAADPVAEGNLPEQFVVRERPDLVCAGSNRKFCPVAGPFVPGRLTCRARSTRSGMSRKLRARIRAGLLEKLGRLKILPCSEASGSKNTVRSHAIRQRNRRPSNCRQRWPRLRFAGSSLSAQRATSTNSDHSVKPPIFIELRHRIAGKR